MKAKWYKWRLPAWINCHDWLAIEIKLKNFKKKEKEKVSQLIILQIGLQLRAIQPIPKFGV